MSSERDAPDMSESGQYFTPKPGARSDPADVDVVLPGAGFRLRTDRGVFSRGRLDAGTALLLRHEHPLPATGDLLDLGCGAGPIALTMAQRSPGATVWAVDVNQRARELCRENATRAGLENIVVISPEELSPDLRFSAIWSNPPIRIGKRALHELLNRWLDLLTGDGSALLVVQKHLGADSLQRWFGEQGFTAERLVSKAGYRLLLVRPAG
jgi:16S rRNA (guanine1207-N2)-methyltransferase